MRLWRHGVGFALLSCVLVAASATATGEEVVLEAYEGPRPADADERMKPVMTELAARGFLLGAALVDRVETRHSRSGQGLQPDEVAAAKRFIDSGYEQFVSGNWELTLRETRRGLDLLRGAPAHLARHQAVRDHVFSALVHMAGAYENLGEAKEATAMMAELLRTFPDREISRAKYAPNIHKLWRTVRDDLRAQGTGSLRVTVDDSRTVVFVNERYVGLGEVSVADLYPGRYRVYVQQGDQHGRVHEVDVDAGASAVVQISWALDSALRTSGAYVGLELPEGAERAEAEARIAVRLARAAGTSGVVVLGLEEVAGRRSLVGKVLSVDSGKPIRSAALAVEPVAPSADKVRALGRFLAGDEAARQIFADVAVEPPTGSAGAGLGGADRGTASRPFKTWKWVALVTGVGALAGGATLIAIHEEPAPGERSEFGRDTRVAGIVTASAGAVLTGLGVYFWIRDRRDAREPRLGVIPNPDGLGIALRGRF